MNPQPLRLLCLGRHQVPPWLGTLKGIPALAAPAASPGGSALKGPLSSSFWDLVFACRA